MTNQTDRLVALAVSEERDRQDAKWGEQNHPDGTSSGLRPLRYIEAALDFPSATPTAHLMRLHHASAADLAAAAQRSTDDAARTGSVTWADIFLEEVFEALAEDDEARLLVELVQVAAVAQQWAAAIHRRVEAREDAHA